MPEDILANKEIKNTKVAKSNWNPDLAQDLGKNQVRMNLMKRTSELGVKPGPDRSMKTQGGTLFRITFILKVCPQTTSTSSNNRSTIELVRSIHPLNWSFSSIITCLVSAGPWVQFLDPLTERKV